MITDGINNKEATIFTAMVESLRTYVREVGESVDFVLQDQIARNQTLRALAHTMPGWASPWSICGISSTGGTPSTA